MLRRLIDEQGIQRPVTWLETPLAVPLLQAVEPSLVVYDCMDELSAFMHAPPELLARERELLARAHVVFTGGPSLYRAKRPLHPRVYCFPSSVHVGHFARARGNCAEAPDQAALPRPRLGFAGVIDERLDTALIDGVAAARPDWQLVLIGPTVKIDPASVPQRPNIAYLGMKPYADLPAYLTGWDVCVMPFARNRSTQFISPTKTLEYMAAGRPIVSTPIGDVAELYGRIVYLADGVERFVAACQQAMDASPLERDARAARARAALRATSWDKTARRMHELLMARLAAGHAPRRERADQPC
jgi:UDP-galactopyranose mutase